MTSLTWLIVNSAMNSMLCYMLYYVVLNIHYLLGRNENSQLNS